MSTNRIDGVEVFAAGTHNGDNYSVQDLDAMVEAFNALDYKPAVKLGHDDSPGHPAYGYIENVRRTGSTLIADLVDLYDKVYEAIKDKRYNRVSAEIYWNLSRAGRTFKRALKAVALLGAEVPGVAGLRPLHEMVFATAAEVKLSPPSRLYVVNATPANWHEAGEEISRLAYARMREAPGESFQVAMVRVCQTNRQLAEIYNQRT